MSSESHCRKSLFAIFLRTRALWRRRTRSWLRPPRILNSRPERQVLQRPLAPNCSRVEGTLSDTDAVLQEELRSDAERPGTLLHEARGRPAPTRCSLAQRLVVNAVELRSERGPVGFASLRDEVVLDDELAQRERERHRRLHRRSLGPRPREGPAYSVGGFRSMGLASGALRSPPEVVQSYPLVGVTESRGFKRTSTARTVDGHHRRPPCAAALAALQAARRWTYAKRTSYPEMSSPLSSDCRDQRHPLWGRLGERP